MWVRARVCVYGQKVIATKFKRGFLDVCVCGGGGARFKEPDAF